MSDHPILITGATGKTGAEAARDLLEQGLPVRALVHRQDDRSTRLATLGAEIATGDLLDIDAVRRALEGVRRAYFVYPIEPGLIEATTTFAQAGAEAGLEVVVNMSQISARRTSHSDAARQHWLAERVLDWSPAGAVHLRPTFFAEWLPINWRFTDGTGVLRLPFAEGRHAPIAATDQARVIAAILANPDEHIGHTYPLYGPVEMNHHEIAEVMSGVLGVPVRYDPISTDAYAEILRDVGRSEHLIQHLSAVAIDYREGIFAGTDDTIERITGKPPQTVEQYVTTNRNLFPTTR
ncbi:NmrA family NAD(P)-binding protein [Herbidospora mongoliensis]|uniref:NmrA family NAD(P)-binding protein n=1 Tax=Herbidospora mongoliensis TaxID=688067 RepID=UPI0008297BF8|nr:NmrA family NAD(P)-binding protein [Herbidospora mongoliensis]